METKTTENHAISNRAYDLMKSGLEEVTVKHEYVTLGEREEVEKVIAKKAYDLIMKGQSTGFYIYNVKGSKLVMGYIKEGFAGSWK